MSIEGLTKQGSVAGVETTRSDPYPETGAGFWPVLPRAFGSVLTCARVAFVPRPWNDWRFSVSAATARFDREFT